LVERRGHRQSFYPTVASLASVSDPNQLGADAQVAAELAELEALAAAMSAAEVDGVAPVQGPQDWS
jgi:hypothetical protein